tara:strand:- start:2184 stop:2360 length:177 start_codon:yes stop_codon:yes gene_type:complete
MKTNTCLMCKHHILGNECEAFTKGIPDEIFLLGTNEHKEPLPGQKNDIVFEPFKPDQN